MTERDSGATPVPADADRRERSDRRSHAGAESRRGHAPDGKSKRLAKIIGRDAIMVVVTLAAIIVGVRITNPIFANQPKVVESLINETPIAKAVLDTMSPLRDTLRAAIVA